MFNDISEGKSLSLFGGSNQLKRYQLQWEGDLLLKSLKTSNNSKDIVGTLKYNRME